MKRLNLLPREARPSRGWLHGSPASLIATVAGPRLIVVMVVVVVVVYGFELAAGWRYERHNRALRRELAVMQSADIQLKEQQQAMSAQRAKLLAGRQKLETRKLALGGVRQPAVPVSLVLSALTETLPQDVWLTKVVLTDEGLKVFGTTTDTKLVAALIGQMDHSGRFRQTTFTSTQRTTEAQAEVFTFELSTTPIWEATRSS